MSIIPALINIVTMIALSNLTTALFMSLNSLFIAFCIVSACKNRKKSVNRRFFIGGYTLVYLCVGETSLVRSFIFVKKLASVKR